MISHWIAVIVLLLIVAGGMALVWPHRKNLKRSLGHIDINGPGSAIGGDHHHHHSSGDGFHSGGDGFSGH
jgi:hypothetical protein